MKNIFNKYPFFGELIRINNLFFNNGKKFNIRLYYEEDMIFFDELLKDFYHILDSVNDIDVVLLSLLNVTGRLLYFQPFYDGNSRTLKHFILLILTDLGYKVFFNKDDFIIPMLFEEEKCCEEDVIIFKEKVKLRKKY